MGRTSRMKLACDGIEFSCGNAFFSFLMKSKSKSAVRLRFFCSLWLCALEISFLGQYTRTKANYLCRDSLLSSTNGLFSIYEMAQVMTRNDQSVRPVKNWERRWKFGQKAESGDFMLTRDRHFSTVPVPSVRSVAFPATKTQRAASDA